MTKSAILGVIAGGRSVPVVTSRLSTDWYTPGITAFFRYYLNPRTTRILANSEQVKKAVLAVEHAASEQVDVIYQGVDLARFSRGDGESIGARELGIPGHAKVVGIVANYRPVKGLPLFLRAAKIVSAQVPEAVFLLVGMGECHGELARLSAELGIAGSVFFSAGKGAVPDYLRRMSIGCLSSESEGFSNAILEYMAAGLPVVATDVGGNGEAVRHGETGLLARDRTPESFAAPIIELLRDEGQRRSMGRLGFERCRELFSMDVYIEHLQAYYRRVSEAFRA
jgi:glycosyltransferase involved in cell wall biosynthesis